MEQKIILENGSYYLKHGINAKIKMNKDVINNGIIMDYKSMKKVWKDIFKTIKPKLYDIIICEPIFFGQRNRDILTNIMLNNYGFRSIKFYNQQLLSLYALGTNKGIVVDIGYSSTKIVPIYDGIILQRGICMSSLCKKNYKDHKFITNPETLDLDCETIPELIKRSIDLSPIDLRKELYESIFIIGGGSMKAGIVKNILIQLRQCSSYPYKIKIRAPKNRDILAWKGAEMLCVLKVI